MYYIGVDLGGTNIAVGIVDENYRILKKGSTPTLAHREMDEIIADMAKLCHSLIGSMDLKVSDIEAVGIATPGTANSDTGVVEYANNLPMRNYPIAAKLGEKFPAKKILIDNDANAAALGEAVAGGAKGAADVVMITLGTGVGGGVIIDHKIYSGFNHAGAELGHMVIEKDGRPCTCGRRGCFEAYSSATGLVNMTKEKMLENPDSLMWKLSDGKIENVGGKTAFAAMRKGDKAAKEVTDAYISYLACGLGNIINIFQPQILCIGGGVCNEGDPLMIPLIEQVGHENYAKNSEKAVRICRAQLGNDAGIIGAAALGMTI